MDWYVCFLFFFCVRPPESTSYAQLQHTNGGGGRAVSQLHLQTEGHHLTCTQWGDQGKWRLPPWDPADNRAKTSSH